MWNKNGCKHGLHFFFPVLVPPFLQKYSRRTREETLMNKLLLPIFVDTAAGLCKTLISFLCDAVVFSLHRSGNWQLLFVIAFNEKRMTFVFFFPFFARQLSSRDRHISYHIQVIFYPTMPLNIQNVLKSFTSMEPQFNEKM